MDDFETHPAGTADLVKRLREKQICTGFEQVEPGVIDCVYGSDPVCQDAADRIEQLEAALTRANAATAAAYEVAAQIADDFVQMRQRQIETEKSKSALHVDVPQIMRWQAGKVQSKAIAAAIRALATHDQTAALDKLIAEAVKPLLIAAKSGLRFIENTESELGIILGCGDSLRNAILAASKKGGV